MITDLINNKWFWIGIAIMAILLAHRLFFSKDESSDILEREYEEIISSDKYKVKGQYD